MTMTHSHTLSLTALVGALVCLSPRVALAERGQVDGSHQIVVDGDHLRVTTRWYAHLPEQASIFAYPLPAGTRFVTRSVAPILDPDDQTIVGISFAQPPPYPLILELELPRSEHEAPIPLALPSDAGWQRIEVEGQHRLIPDLGPALPMHTAGYYAPGQVHVPERLRIDRGLDGRHPAGAAYIPGATLIEAGGLPARLESGAARKLGLGIAAGAAFFSGLLVLAVVLRRQASVVEAERAQAYLDEEFRILEDADPLP
jgi:hypothetical protein